MVKVTGECFAVHTPTYPLPTPPPASFHSENSCQANPEQANKKQEEEEQQNSVTLLYSKCGIGITVFKTLLLPSKLWSLSETGISL